MTATMEAANGKANSHHSSGTSCEHRRRRQRGCSWVSLDASDCEHIWFSGTLMTVKAGGEHTRDGFTLIEVSTPPVLRQCTYTQDEKRVVRPYPRVAVAGFLPRTRLDSQPG